MGIKDRLLRLERGEIILLRMIKSLGARITVLEKKLADRVDDGK